MLNSDKITISKSEYKLLNRVKDKLTKLEDYGVSNWQHYDEALREWNKQEELDNLIEDMIQDINDLLTEADVDQPAGQGCGYRIEIDEENLAKYLKEFGENYHDKAKQ